MFALGMFLIQGEDVAKRRINPLNTIGRHSFIPRYRKCPGAGPKLALESCRARPLPINANALSVGVIGRALQRVAVYRSSGFAEQEHSGARAEKISTRLVR
jgi:hypothetical protein